MDLGTDSPESTDYPDYAFSVARSVSSGDADRGVLVCSTGVGMSIAANKLIGIRAALGVLPEEVKLARSHNDANVLTLGSTYTQEDDAGKLIDIFLTTQFEGGRHARRIAKIMAMEQSQNSERGEQ